MQKNIWNGFGITIQKYEMKRESLHPTRSGEKTDQLEQRSGSSPSPLHNRTFWWFWEKRLEGGWVKTCVCAWIQANGWERNAHCGWTDGRMRMDGCATAALSRSVPWGCECVGGGGWGGCYFFLGLKKLDWWAQGWGWVGGLHVRGWWMRAGV